MSRFDQVALVAAGLLVAALYGIVASDFFATGAASQRSSQAVEPVPPQPRRSEAPASTPVAKVAKPKSVFALPRSEKDHKIFESIGYRLRDVHRHGEVPRVFTRTLPRDLRTMRRADLRKRAFIKLVLPLVLYANDQVLADRKRIETLRERHGWGMPLTVTDQAWLAGKLKEYRLDSLDFDELLRRTDAVPPSLALAQSAEESGWGTSRFAHEGNALFGQRIWDSSNGIVPHERGEGQNFRVRAFDHLKDGVISYIRNLNTHPAYSSLRRMRASMRRAGLKPDGAQLAEALRKYSERGEEYTKNIQTIIRVNELSLFDRVRLRADAPAGEPASGT